MFSPKEIRYLKWRYWTLFPAVLGMGIPKNISRIHISCIQLTCRWGWTLHFKDCNRWMLTTSLFSNWAHQTWPGKKKERKRWLLKWEITELDTQIQIWIQFAPSFSKTTTTSLRLHPDNFGKWSNLTCAAAHFLQMGCFNHQRVIESGAPYHSSFNARDHKGGWLMLPNQPVNMKIWATKKGPLVGWVI